MTAYRGGANMYVQWASDAGTVTLQGDYKTFSYTPAIDLYDQSGGSDTNRTYVNGIKDGNASIMVNMQAAGTTITNALAEGASGTLTVGPEGTATGQQKIVLPAIAEIPSPAFNPPNHFLETSNTSSRMPVLEAVMPMRTNIGTTLMV